MSVFKRVKRAEFGPKHFKWSLENKVGTITINRPERKNPLSFQSYGELRDTFRELQYGLFEPEKLLAEATVAANELAAGPCFAHAITKGMMH